MDTIPEVVQRWHQDPVLAAKVELQRHFWAIPEEIIRRAVVAVLDTFDGIACVAESVTRQLIDRAKVDFIDTVVMTDLRRRLATSMMDKGLQPVGQPVVTRYHFVATFPGVASAGDDVDVERLAAMAVPQEAVDAGAYWDYMAVVLRVKYRAVGLMDLRRAEAGL